MKYLFTPSICYGDIPTVILYLEISTCKPSYFVAITLYAYRNTFIRIIKCIYNQNLHFTYRFFNSLFTYFFYFEHKIYNIVKDQVSCIQCSHTITHQNVYFPPPLSQSLTIHLSHFCLGKIGSIEQFLNSVVFGNL